MIDPKTELFRWGPIDGVEAFIEPFTRAFKLYHDYEGIGWPDIIGYFEENTVLFILDFPKLRVNGQKLFSKYFENPDLYEKEYGKFLAVIEKISGMEKEVNGDLSHKSDEELTELLKTWDQINLDLWVYGYLPEVANYGQEQVIKQRLEEMYPDKAMEYFEIITAPSELSFFQKEELEFLKLKLLDNPSEKLQEHASKYYWLRNSYGEVKTLDAAYFQDELGNLSKEDSVEKIKEIEAYTSEIKNRKLQLDIDPGVTAQAELLAQMVWWQDYRKQFIFIANHITSQFMKEISKRNELSLSFSKQ